MLISKVRSVIEKVKTQKEKKPPDLIRPFADLGGGALPKQKAPGTATNRCWSSIAQEESILEGSCLCVPLTVLLSALFIAWDERLLFPSPAGLSLDRQLTSSTKCVYVHGTTFSPMAILRSLNQAASDHAPPQTVAHTALTRPPPFHKSSPSRSQLLRCAPLLSAHTTLVAQRLQDVAVAALLRFFKPCTSSPVLPFPSCSRSACSPLYSGSLHPHDPWLLSSEGTRLAGSVASRRLTGFPSMTHEIATWPLLSVAVTSSLEMCSCWGLWSVRRSPAPARTPPRSRRDVRSAFKMVTSL